MLYLCRRRKYRRIIFMSHDLLELNTQQYPINFNISHLYRLSDSEVPAWFSHVSPDEIQLNIEHFHRLPHSELPACFFHLSLYYINFNMERFQPLPHPELPARFFHFSPD